MTDDYSTLDARLTSMALLIETLAKEREKFATVVRSELEQAISSGDERLREHILNQVQQIKDALISADKLEQSRIAIVAEISEKQQSVADARYDASQDAIVKAEKLAEKKFDDANEWRGQSADRERTQKEQIANLTTTFIPREVADTQFIQLNKQMRDLQQFQAKIIGGMALFGILIPFITAVAVYLLTRHGITLNPSK